jgi:hypothetical protein
MVARSTAESEYRAMVFGVSEEMWLQRVLFELVPSEKSSIKLYCDNKIIIYIANNYVQHDQIKHIKIDHHFIKEKLDNGVICLPFVRMTEQSADVFTKRLHTTKLSSVICKINMKYIYNSTREGVL